MNETRSAHILSFILVETLALIACSNIRIWVEMPTPEQVQPTPLAGATVTSPAAPPVSPTPVLTLEATTQPTETAETATLIQTVQNFPAPGEIVTGITWDGTHLWLSDVERTIFKVDTSGKTLDAFSIGSTPVSLAWDGSSFWMFARLTVGPPWDVIYQVQMKEGEVKTLSSFEATEGDSGGGLLRNDLEWDGESLWFSNISQNNVYRIDTSGNILSRFAFPKRVTGVAWDGSYLWLAYNDDPFSNSTISVVDAEGNILDSFPSPVFEIAGLAWGDGYLWAVGKEGHPKGFGSRTEIVFQLDVSLARDVVTPSSDSSQ